MLSTIPDAMNEVPSADTKAPGRKALLVVNAASSGARDSKRYVEALADAGITLLKRDTRRDRLNDLILSMRTEVDTVILAGGDSTMSAGAIALRDTGLPLGIVPIGANNELAHKLGLPTEPEEVAATIMGGHTKKLDLGSVNGRPFFNVATIGLTIESARLLERASHGRFGRIGYMWVAAKIAFNNTRFSAIVRCGAVVHRVRTIQITIGNGRYYKAGMLPDEEPVPESRDSYLGVYSLEPEGKWTLVRLARAFEPAEDGEDQPEVRLDRSPVVEVVTRLPRPISADGEIVTVTPARFGILPRAVTVLVPAPPPAPTPEPPPPPEPA